MHAQKSTFKILRAKGTLERVNNACGLFISFLSTELILSENTKII